MRTIDFKSACLALVFLAGAALAQTPCPTRTSWPTETWPVQPVTGKEAAIAALESFAFTIQGDLYGRKGLHTDGLIIVKGGTIIYEKYARGFGENTRHISWSVAKSISSTLVGIAVKQGALSLSDSICTVIPELQGGERCDISVKDAITFGTGLDWQEEYENASYQVSSVISMLFGVGHRDHLSHILGHRYAGMPSRRWNYSTGDAELASALAKRALSAAHGQDAFWTVLFDRIGMRNTTFEEDLKGTPMGGSNVFATPRDFARFGYLFLNDGCWEGERLVPEGWVRDATTVSEVFQTAAPSSEKVPSGYAWWLNAEAHGNPRPWPDAPPDAYSAIGHWGQRVMVVPSADVVVVRVGDDRDTALDNNQLLKLSLAVAQ